MMRAFVFRSLAGLVSLGFFIALANGDLEMRFLRKVGCTMMAIVFAVFAILGEERAHSFLYYAFGIGSPKKSDDDGEEG